MLLPVRYYSIQQPLACTEDRDQGVEVKMISYILALIWPGPLALLRVSRNQALVAIGEAAMLVAGIR
jgi:hypothetical protein